MKPHVVLVVFGAGFGHQVSATILELRQEGQLRTSVLRNISISLVGAGCLAK